MKRSFFFLLVIPLISCSLFTNENDGYEAALKKWQESKFPDYEFRYGMLCYCIRTTPALIVVKSDTIYQVLNIETRDSLMIETGENSVEYAGDLFKNHFKTIDELFEVIKDARAKGAHKLEVDYDVSNGFPVLIDIDYIKEAADDEIRYSVSEYQAYQVTVF